MSLTLERVAELRAGTGEPMTDDERIGLCIFARHRLLLRDSNERTRLKRQAENREPDPCEICGEEMIDSAARYAGVAHWSCYEKQTARRG